MPRSEHFLFRSRPSPWPKAVVALGVEIAWSQDVVDVAKQHATLSLWHVAIAAKADSGYAVSRIASGATSDSFWDGLKECAERSKGVTILCSNTRESAAVLHLWEALENGDVKIAGSDQRNQTSGRRDVPDLQGGGAVDALGRQVPMDASALSGVRSGVGEKRGNGRRHSRKTSGRPGGILILQDPPIVMELMIGDCPYKVVWLDVANYGLDSSALFGNDELTATKVATWFCGAASSIKSLGDAGWQNTAGSQAMHLFRSTYLEESILSHTHPKASSLERSALFGGRCECFCVGRCLGPVHLLDIRSMYPYLCATIPVPVRLSRVVERPSPDELGLLSSEFFTIAEVAIQTDTPNYPVRHGNAVAYPTGRYWAYLSGAELDNALANGDVRGVRSCALYETESALARYATELYRLRCRFDGENKSGQSAFIKRLMVSLVGKFAQSERGWEDYPDGESAFEWGEWYQRSSSGESERWRSIAGHLQREYIGGWGHGAVPGITVSITSAGRRRLLDIMVAAGRENVLYCDTDAVIVDDYGLESLTLGGWVRAGEWGYLQHVQSADECTIYGDKYYTIGARSRQAGIAGTRHGGVDEGIRTFSQPWIGSSMKHQERPADWRTTRPYVRGEGRYDKVRCPGGVVKPVELWEW